jgi:hypothetical protein
MRLLLPALLITAFLFFTSCGNKNEKQTERTDHSLTKDSLSSGQAPADTTLAAVMPVIEKKLNAWAKSFNGFSADSFKYTQTTKFEEIAYQDTTGMDKFYELYKPSLVFSGDSSQFIDIYSAGIMLEKRGMKTFASSDVDQAITLCNLRTGDWRRIAFFGPSAGIEEAVWVSATEFVLAGIIRNDNGDPMPFLLWGDAQEKSIRWFESSIIRPQSVNYEASGLAKLKIDEWE